MLCTYSESGSPSHAPTRAHNPHVEFYRIPSDARRVLRTCIRRVLFPSLDSMAPRDETKKTQGVKSAVFCFAGVRSFARSALYETEDEEKNTIRVWPRLGIR